MSLRLLKQYLSFRTAIAAVLLSMANPAGLVKMDLFAAPPTSIEIATFKEQDLVDILSGKGPIKKDYEGTQTHVQIDELLLKNEFKFYLDSSNNVRQQLGSSPSSSDPQVVRLAISAGSKKAKATYVDDARPDGDGYRFKIKRPDGSEDSIFVRIPAGASREEIEALIRKALEDRGYTIGDDGKIYLDGTYIGDDISMIIDSYISDGDDYPSSRRRRTYDDRDYDYPGGGDSWDIEHRRGPGGKSRRHEVDVDGPGSWDGGGNFDFNFDGDFSFEDGFGPGGGGYIGSDGGFLRFRLPGGSRVFSSGPNDIINNDKMVSDWGNYDFKVGNIQYRLQKMDIPGWFNDEWVILRKGPGDTWFLIKQDEHAALMEILKNSGNPAYVEAYSKLKSKDAHEWDGGDYANVRTYDMKSPSDGSGSDDFDINIDGDASFGPGGINRFIYENRNLSPEELQDLLDAKYGKGVVIVDKDPSSGKMRFRFKQGGPNGDGSMTDWIFVDSRMPSDNGDWGDGSDIDVIMRNIGNEYGLEFDDSDFGPDGSSSRSRTHRRGPGGGSTYEDETTYGPGGRSRGPRDRDGYEYESSRSSKKQGSKGNLADEIRSIFDSGGGGSTSKSKTSTTKDKSETKTDRSTDRSSDSSDTTTTIDSGEHPELERLADGRWRLTIPIPVDEDGDGDVDYYNYQFEYLNPGDVDAEGKIKDSVMNRILDKYKGKGIDFSRVSTRTTAPGASNVSDRDSSNENRVEVRVFKNKDEAVATMKTEKWLKFVIDQASGYYIDANGEQRALAIGIDPITGTTPEQLDKAVEKLNDVKDLVNQK